MTLVEILVALAIVGMLLLPITKFMTGIFKGLLHMDTRYKNQDYTLRSVVDIERDFKDMNEVFYCDAKTLTFSMDSHRAPSYSPTEDPDTDLIPNRVDTDDDRDGFDNVRTASTYRTLDVGVAGSGWRHGLDLQDDDDDNNGGRDVLCTYWFDPAAQALYRQFTYSYRSDTGTTVPQVVLSHVIASTFTPTGSFATRDPITGNPPDFVDTDTDGVLSVSEIGGFPLDTFKKTRYITTVAYTMTIQPNPARPETFVVKSSVKPILMGVKEKYR